MGKPKSICITPLPLQRLPISFRIKFKVFAMTYKALYSLVPHYASKLIAYTLPLLLSGWSPRNRVPDYLRDFALAVLFPPGMPSYVCICVNLSPTSDSAQMPPSQWELPWLLPIYLPCFIFLLSPHHCLKYCVLHLVICLLSPFSTRIEAQSGPEFLPASFTVLSLSLSLK